MQSSSGAKKTITVDWFTLCQVVSEERREEKCAEQCAAKVQRALEQSVMPCEQYMRGRCPGTGFCSKSHNYPRIGCKKFMYGECTYGDKCIYSHKYRDLCPILVREGQCRRAKCMWSHRVPKKPEVKKAPAVAPGIAPKGGLVKLFAKASELETKSSGAQHKTAGEM